MAKRTRLPARSHPLPPSATRRVAATPRFLLLLIVAGLLAYSSSFRGVFVGDDTDAIINNPHVRSLAASSSPWDALLAPRNTTVAGRPVVSLSLAVNYALSSPGGLDPWGYHAVNLGVHLCAALALFGVVRRTLSTTVMRDRFGPLAVPAAFCCALLWLVHPLQTAAVTYVVQRAESLMGLFFLLTLYCAIRATGESARWRWWTAGSITACALGMGTKETMVVAPLVVAFWIWTFDPEMPLRSGRTLPLIGGLAGTWIVLALLVAGDARSESAGFGLGGWTWWVYLRTQSAVIVEYLRLAIVPSPLVFMYEWPPARSWMTIAPQLTVLTLLGAVTIAALVRQHPAGFAGAWFFLLLAPSSSVLPVVTEVAAEHRMYLPLAAVIVPCVLGAWRYLPAIGAWSAIAVIAVTFGTLTHARNRDYWSLEALMQDTVEKRPENVRARVVLGGHLLGLERFGDAERHLRVAVAASSSSESDRSLSAMAHMYLGSSLAAQNKLEEGIVHLEKARELNPALGEPHAFLGEAYASQGRLVDAARSFERAAEALPGVPPLLDRAARLLATAPEPAARSATKAVRFAERAVELTRGEDWLLIDTLAAAYAEQGRFEHAAATVRRAIEVAGRTGAAAARPILESHLALFESRQPLRER